MAPTSAIATPRAGMLVSCAGVYYRLTHRVGEAWYGARLGIDVKSARSGLLTGAASTFLWPVPRPFLLDTGDRATSWLLDNPED